jgi:guanylate cyclase
MESHGERGIVQITRNTFELIGDRFDCQSRGTISVKGAGQIEVWHVVGPKAARDAS